MWKPLGTNTKLGEVGKGIHKPHVAGTAISDYIFTVVGALLLGLIPGGPNWTWWTITLFLLAVIFHLIFGIETDTTKWIYKSNTTFYTTVIVVVCYIVVISLFKYKN